jgi:AbrB family looped-hinge helix DNA binding protein
VKCQDFCLRHVATSHAIGANMTLQVKVSSKCQVAMPASVRRRLSIEAGDDLLVDIHDDVEFLIPKPVDRVEVLHGLGREIWADADAQDYVTGEREDRGACWTPCGHMSGSVSTRRCS